MNKIPIAERPEAERNNTSQTSVADVEFATAHSVTRSGFVGNVLKLVSGSVSAQIISLATAPLIARLFAPAAFGTAGIFVSLIGVFSAVVGMRYELSIVLPKKDDEAINTGAVSLCFILLTTLIIAILVVVAGDPLLRLLKAPELHGYLWLAPIAVFLNGIFAALGYWNTRKKHFGRQTIAQIVAAVFFAVAQLGAGFSGYATGGTIIASTVLSIFVSTIVLGVPTWRDCGTLIIREVRVRRMFEAFKRYSGFPKYNSASAALNNLGWQLPTLFLSAFFSPSVVGQFAVGNKVLRVPVSLVGANIATVFFQHASEAHHRGDLRESVDYTFKYLIKIFAFPSLLLCLIGEDLFAVIFGNRWAEAGIYTQILSLYVLFWFLAVPLGLALNVLDKQALEMRLVATALIVRAAALWFGGMLGNARLTLSLFSAAGVVVYGYYFFVVLRNCGVSLSSITRLMGRQLITFLPAGILLGLLKWFHGYPLLVLAVAAILLTIYYSHLLRTDLGARQVLAGVQRKLLLGKTDSVPLVRAS